MAVEKYQFQTEAQKLLRLMINSLYSNREVFLRELISNASDAIDKLKFDALSDSDLANVIGEDFSIEITTNEDDNTLTVADNGIGMDHDQVITNLGTIAKSGTEEFFERLTGDVRGDSNLIGQFGVGFYSAFLVADKVVVDTCNNEDQNGVRWISTGESDFEVETCKRTRGTSVHLYLKDDAKEFLESFRLRMLVKQYSDHVAVPVKMLEQDTGDEEKEKKPQQLETINSAQALWTRSRSDLNQDEYNEFYKSFTHDWDDPLLCFHNRVEGKMDYTSLLFVPKHAPWDLWNRPDSRELKLYAQRVFITEDDGTVLPEYLRWVKGVIDISDFPLNMSRETLMADTQLSSIKGAVTKRILDGLLKLAKDKTDDYLEFWSDFGSFMKTTFEWHGGQRESFLKLMRFSSTATDDNKQERSLEDYVENKQKDQEKIYYLVGDSVESLRSNPLLEVYAANDIEVLLLTDDYDSWAVPQFGKFDDLEFVDVGTTSDDIPGETFEANGSEVDESVIKQIKDVLGDDVEDVKASTRLKDHASCLIAKEPVASRGVRTMASHVRQPEFRSPPILELNMGHPLIDHLRGVQDQSKFEEVTRVLYDQAKLASGTFAIEPGPFVQRVNNLLVELLN